MAKLLALSLLVAGVAGAASAQTVQASSVAVNISGLSRTEARLALSKAAHQVCAGDEDVLSAASDDCYSATMNEALVKLHAARLAKRVQTVQSQTVAAR